MTGTVLRGPLAAWTLFFFRPCRSAAPPGLLRLPDSPLQTHHHTRASYSHRIHASGHSIPSALNCRNMIGVLYSEGGRAYLITFSQSSPLLSAGVFFHLCIYIALSCFGLLETLEYSVLWQIVSRRFLTRVGQRDTTEGLIHMKGRGKKSRNKMGQRLQGSTQTKVE